MVVSPPSVRRPSPPVTRPTRRPSRSLVTSRPWRESRDRHLRRPSRHAAARPARTVGHARAVRARGLPAAPRRRFVAGTPGWADGSGSGGEGKRGRPPRRGALGEPAARAGRVTLRSRRIAVPISVVFVTLVLPQTGRPRRRRRGWAADAIPAVHHVEAMLPTRREDGYTRTSRVVMRGNPPWCWPFRSPVLCPVSGARRGAGAPAQRIDSRYARRVTRRSTPSLARMLLR